MNTKIRNLKNSGRFTRKQKLIFFVVGFGLVGAYVVYRSFAATPMQLSAVFKNFTTNHPSKVSIEAKTQYKNSKDIKVAKLNYALNRNQADRTYRQHGTLDLDGRLFPFDVRYQNYYLFFKVGGLSKLSQVVPSKSYAYSYFKPRFNLLAQANNKWHLINRDGTSQGDHSDNEPGSILDCFANVQTSFDSYDIDKLRSAFRASPPVKFSGTKSTKLKGEKVKRFNFVSTSASNRNSFAEEILGLDKILEIRTCIDSYYADPLIAESIFASLRNNTKISIYVNAKNLIKRAEINLDNRNSNTKININFEYGGKPTITTPRKAEDGHFLIDQLINQDAYTQQ